jgi:hypothetical protein
MSIGDFFGAAVAELETLLGSSVMARRQIAIHAPNRSECEKFLKDQYTCPESKENTDVEGACEE